MFKREAPFSSSLDLPIGTLVEDRDGWFSSVSIGGGKLLMLSAKATNQLVVEASSRGLNDWAVELGDAAAYSNGRRLWVRRDWDGRIRTQDMPCPWEDRDSFDEDHDDFCYFGWSLPWWMWLEWKGLDLSSAGRKPRSRKARGGRGRSGGRRRR